MRTDATCPAELPQLARRALVVVDDIVDLVDVKLAGAQPIDRTRDMLEQRGELRLVVARHAFSGRPTLCLRAHCHSIADPHARGDRPDDDSEPVDLGGRKPGRPEGSHARSAWVMTAAMVDENTDFTTILRPDAPNDPALGSGSISVVSRWRQGVVSECSLWPR